MSNSNDSREAVAASIRRAATSIREDPSQFTFTVSVTGTHAVGGPGGPGIHAAAYGGQAGSQAIGFYAGGVTQASVSIARGQADTAAAGRASSWAAELDALASVIEKGGRQPEIKPVLDRVVAAGLPAAVSSLVTGLVGLAF